MRTRLGKSQNLGVKRNGTLQIIYSVTSMQQFFNNGHGSEDANTGEGAQDLSRFLCPFALDLTGAG